MLNSRILIHRIKLLLRARRGAAAVEFAMLMPVITALFIGVINYGLIVFDQMELNSAARAGAQMALLDASSTSVIQQVVVDSTNLTIDATDVTVTETCNCYDGTTALCTTTTCSGQPVEHYFNIDVTEDYTFLLIPTTITLSGSASVRTE
jgi:Flp pilus assembly protein TadG